MRLEIEKNENDSGIKLILHFEGKKCKDVGDGFYTLSNEAKCLNVNFNWSDKMAVWEFYKGGGLLKTKKEIEEFINSTKDKKEIYMANAYETSSCLLLSEKPEKIKLKMEGGGFEGHGTTAFIDDCPKRLLILGQND